MRDKNVVAFPYATVCGTIRIPENMPAEKEQEYIEEHFGEIKFNEPTLDFAGAYFEFYDEEAGDDQSM